MIGIIVIGILWHYKPTTISVEKAVNISRSILTDKEIQSITNYDAPLIEVTCFHKEPNIHKYDTTLIFKDKKVYVITYTTKYDALLGPITIYIDAGNGVVYGMNNRL